MKKYFVLLLFFTSIFLKAQSIEKEWKFESIKNNDGISLVEINSSDSFSLNEGEFKYSLIAKDSLEAEGSYTYQNNLLIFKYDKPKDTIRQYSIDQLTDSILVISENDVFYSFNRIHQSEENIIQPSQGFSLTSLWRGILGMSVLLLIAFLFSAKRRAVDWKKVVIGLSLQLLIAIGVLKIPFIQKAFEFVGKIFIQILEYTKSGSKFLFEGLISDMDTFGYIFAFQVLPTIIFFSALTSLLFYLGIIQWLFFKINSTRSKSWVLGCKLGYFI